MMYELVGQIQKMHVVSLLCSRAMNQPVKSAKSTAFEENDTVDFKRPDLGRTIIVRWKIFKNILCLFGFSKC